MKQYLLFLLLASAGLSVSAQVVDVNPLAEWKFIRSQELELHDRSIYQFEFPADTAYEYLINLTIKEANIETFIAVTDLQNKPIGGSSLEQKREQLQFEVPALDTYRISLIYKGPSTDDGRTPITVTLIRRPSIN
ncbi:MAG: hypothetical protein P8N47_04085 [Bacteroidia bacterium]|jgi:hypothetical protein|nr:hypothetical protein [Bacteroidia bacterium]